MIKRPKMLDVFGFFLLAVALSVPVQIMVIFGHSPLEWEAILAKVTSLNWLMMAALVVNAYLIQEASPMVVWTLPVAAVLVGFNNWVVGHWGIDYSPTQTWLASGGFVFCHGVLFQKPIVELFKNPGRRWWLTPRRKKVEILAHVNPYNGLAFRTKTFDLSEGGAFLELTAEKAAARGPRGERNRKITVNDHVSLCLTLGLAQIRCDARVVRSTEARGDYPAGIGLSFEGMGRHQRRELRRFMASRA